MEIKEKLIFKSLFGSRLYGTFNENSDIDYKGVFLPNKEDLLLGNAPKCYQLSSGGNNKNTKDDIDETYYSLHYFLSLLALGETNSLDLFFAKSNKEAIIYEDPIWTELTNNADKLITKNINKYLGYCRSQAIKYSVKGERLANYLALKNILDKSISNNEKDNNGSWITLGTLLDRYNFKLDKEIEYKKHDKAIGVRAKILDSPFGDHSYFVEMVNKEQYLMISDILFNFYDTTVASLHKLDRTIKQYGKRAEIAKNHNGEDHKALSHAVRTLFQAEELITTGKITFPLAEDKLKLVKSIKYNNASMTYEEIVDYIDNKIQYINNELLLKSTLRESADMNFINSFILKQYL